MPISQQPTKLINQLIFKLNNVLIYKTPIPEFTIGHSMKLDLFGVTYEDVKDLDI